MTGELARALTSAGHRMAQGALTLNAAVAQQRRIRQPSGTPASSIPAARGGTSPRRDDPTPRRDDPSPGQDSPEPVADRPVPADNGPGQPAGQPQAALDQLAAGLTESTGTLAASLREMRPPGRLPPLRRLQAATMAGDDAAADALFAATDGLVDAIDTAADILRRHLDGGPAGP